MAMLQSVIAGGGSLEDSKEVLNYIKNYNRNRTLDEVIEMIKTAVIKKPENSNDRAHNWILKETINELNQLKSE